MTGRCIPAVPAGRADAPRVCSIDDAVAQADFGRATAAKRGRNSRWPYVPVIERTDSVGCVRTEQIRARAFATRDEAVAFAERYIERARQALADDLAKPNMRALREWHGLPRELVTP